jgi:CDGSH-type Zn-finger protein
MSTIIKVNHNGSLRIEGDFVIIDPDGNQFDLQGRTSVALCRCNLSNKRPFCDGAHKGNFMHEVKAFALPPIPKKEG